MRNVRQRKGAPPPVIITEETGSSAAHNASTKQTHARIAATLRAPENNDMLDFSATFPAVSVEQSVEDAVSTQSDDEEDIQSAPGARATHSQPLRGRDLVRLLWRMLRRPKGRHIWKLLPIWMVINLVLLIAVLAVMASQVLPKSLHVFDTSCTWYTVSFGDTLYAISASYHVSADTVAQANHLKSYGAIKEGQQLCIPLNAATLVPMAQGQVVLPNVTTYGSAAQGPAAFILFALPYARSAHQQTGWPMSMILAQWALEHGWSIPTFTGYNWGNVGALPGVPLVASGGAPGAPLNFSYAPTPDDGVNYYVAVASLPFYQAVAPAGHRSANAAAQALGASPWDAGHYTNTGNPGSSLVTIMQDFNLYRYDTN